MSDQTQVSLPLFCGGVVKEEQVSFVRGLIQRYRHLSRTELAATVCELLGWVRKDGPLRARTVRQEKRRVHGQRVVFATKYAQAVARIQRLAMVFTEAPILVIADSWFGNNGLWQPLTAALGQRAQLLSRLRVNSVLYDPLANGPQVPPDVPASTGNG